MFLTRLQTGDRIYRTKKCIVVQFDGKRKVLSTANLNGGYREDLESVFNFDSKPDGEKNYCMRSDTYERDLSLVARELGMDPERTAGISTAVSMENVSIKSEIYEDLTVTAIVTAGIEVNGGRVGDPASFYESEDQIIMIKRGTINIILSIDVDMMPGTLSRTIVTCTEAKSAAVQELMARSMYSRGLATGSGTDETIVICNSDSGHKLKFAGKHSKLGELIGKVVKEAVKESLDLETGLNPTRQHSVQRRLDRFGIDKEAIWSEYSNREVQPLKRDEFMSRLEILDQDPDLVVQASLYAHLIDQLDWRLLKTEEVASEAEKILNRIGDFYGVALSFEIESNTTETVILSMVESFIDLLIEVLVST